jgi:CO dehydrogenase/acetyl-CoA synthase delta subunit
MPKSSLGCCSGDRQESRASCDAATVPAEEERQCTEPGAGPCCGGSQPKTRTCCSKTPATGSGRLQPEPVAISCCFRAETDASCTCEKDFPDIQSTTSTLTGKDKIDHVLARWGVNRTGHRVRPGLYRLGNPGADSPVLVSANYTLSFDALRSSLRGKEAYILVLDTKGINVWCAAGKGTFGTDELVRMIMLTNLASVVRHREIIVPQLGAPGIAAHEVARRSGFRVRYGPVRASDLPGYLETGRATPEMRRVLFPFRDRIVLAPVELVHAALPTVVAAVILYFLAGPIGALAVLATVIAGTVLFPALLPFLPTEDFSTKGIILGALVAMPFAVFVGTLFPTPSWATAIAIAVPLLLIPAVVAYMALNFTGCTPYTSRTGVKKEIFQYIPVLVLLAVTGTAFLIVLGVSLFIGVI